MRLLLYCLAAIALLVMLFITGCAHSLGYAGAHPGAVECYGKGTITGTGQGAMAVVYGGAETNAFTLTIDCGGGAGIKQGNPQPAPAKP